MRREAEGSRIPADFLHLNQGHRLAWGHWRPFFLAIFARDDLMATTPRILALAGSSRRDSFNKKLIRIAVGGAREAGADVTLIELEDYPLPLFNQDDEAASGLPANGRKLKDLFLSHQGLLIASPEYNSSITPLLKNTIDWVSRPVEGEPPLACFTDKTAVLMSASPGALGGLRGLVHVRAILGNIGVVVLPATISIPSAAQAFAADGSLADAKKQAQAGQLGAVLAGHLARLRPDAK
jgi:NAD(P)H-dependent FMN reductase